MASTDFHARRETLARARAEFESAEFQWRKACVGDNRAEAQRARNAYVAALAALKRAKEALNECV